MERKFYNFSYQGKGMNIIKMIQYNNIFHANFSGWLQQLNWFKKFNFRAV